MRAATGRHPHENAILLNLKSETVALLTVASVASTCNANHLLQFAVFVN